jgi:hypothetical protein
LPSLFFVQDTRLTKENWCISWVQVFGNYHQIWSFLWPNFLQLSKPTSQFGAVPPFPVNGKPASTLFGQASQSFSPTPSFNPFGGSSTFGTSESTILYLSSSTFGKYCLTRFCQYPSKTPCFWHCSIGHVKPTQLNWPVEQAGIDHLLRIPTRPESIRHEGIRRAHQERRVYGSW